MQDVIVVVENFFLVCRRLFSSGKALNDKTSQRHNSLPNSHRWKNSLMQDFFTLWARMESKWIFFWIKKQQMASDSIFSRLLGFMLHIYWNCLRKATFWSFFTHTSCNRVAMKLYVKTHFKHKWDLQPTNFFNINIHFGYDIFLKTLL